MKEVVTLETADTFPLRVQQLNIENAALRPIIVRMVETCMCLDGVAKIESYPHCSLKRGGEYSYAWKHDKMYVVTQARQLGF